MGRYPELDEIVLKHLEFIQGTIARMGYNSFLLKGWSVTLVAAIIALSVRGPSIHLILIGLFPALAFWGLDAFYLGQERLFRRLYEDVLRGKVDAFSMDPSGYESGVKGLFHSALSRSVLPLHGAVTGTVVLVVVILLFFV